MRRSTQIVMLLLPMFMLSALLAQFQSRFVRSPKPLPEVGVEQLVKMLANQPIQQTPGVDRPVPSFIIVDVRSPEEVNVSMIAGAITREQFELNAQQFRDRTVIVYCTIGYRSGQYASKLIEQGFAAKNFKGSILAWCEAQQPLVTPQGQATNRVHTYSPKYRVSELYKAVW